MKSLTYLHRVMFVLFVLVPYFTFNGEAEAKRYHRHHKVKVVTKIKEVVKVVTIKEEAKTVFPVINAGPMEYVDVNISKLLASIPKPYVDRVDSTQPGYSYAGYNAVDSALDIQETLDAKQRQLIGSILILAGIFFITPFLGEVYNGNKATVFRIRSRSARTRAAEVVRSAYRRWQACDYAGTVAYYGRRIRQAVFGRSRTSLQQASGSRLIHELLPRLPNKYFRRFDIPS